MWAMAPRAGQKSFSAPGLADAAVARPYIALTQLEPVSAVRNVGESLAEALGRIELVEWNRSCAFARRQQAFSRVFPNQSPDTALAAPTSPSEDKQPREQQKTLTHRTDMDMYDIAGQTYGDSKVPRLTTIDANAPRRSLWSRRAERVSGVASDTGDSIRVHRFVPSADGRRRRMGAMRDV